MPISWRASAASSFERDKEELMSEATKSGRPEETSRPGPNRRFRRPSIFVAAAFAIAGLTSISAPATAAVADPTPASICPDASSTLFGPNVCVFSTSMTQAQIQTDLDAIATQQVPVASQFDSGRYAILFEPGTYGSEANPLVFQVGYYTEVAGLGAMPGDTVVDGAIDVFNNLCTAGTQDCNVRRQLLALPVQPDPERRPPLQPTCVRPAGP